MAVATGMGLSFDTVLYMKTKPDRATLEELASILVDPVEDLVRKDSRFKKLELNADDYIGNPAAVVELLARQPALLQRPIIVRGDRAIIGRPKERVAEFLE